MRGHLDDDQVARRLTQVLRTEADAISAPDSWDALTSRFSTARPRRRRAWRSLLTPRSRRRRTTVLTIAAAVAVVVVLVVAVAWRPTTAQAPIAPVPPPVGRMAVPDVPYYNPTIPTLTVYRVRAADASAPSKPVTTYKLQPEYGRTASADVGRAALSSMLDGPAVQPEAVERKLGRADITSVAASGGLIWVQLKSYAGLYYAEPEAAVIAQAWVRTLQDTLGVRDGVMIRLEGKPFTMYGEIDTTRPLERDDAVEVVRPDQLDSPRNGDVVPATFLLLGVVSTDPGRTARVQVLDLTTDAVVYEQDLPGGTVGAAVIEVQAVLTLPPGRYRATVAGQGPDGGVRDISFTVVA